MPSNVVHTDRDEEKWEKAKKRAKEQGHAGEYDYIMGIYKKMKPSHDFKKESQMTPFEQGYSSFMKLANRMSSLGDFLESGVVAATDALSSRPAAATLLPGALQDSAQHGKHLDPDAIAQMMRDRDLMNRVGGLAVGGGLGLGGAALMNDE